MACTLLRCIFVLSCSLMVTEVCLGRVIIHEQVVPNSAGKVPVRLYYESLCPGCQQFVLEGLAPIFKNGLIDIVELKLIPWGWAKVLSKESFKCQHGPTECLLNTVEACAIDAWPSASVHFPFIECVEKLAYQGKHSEWETCFTKLSLDPKPVKECSSNGHGKELELYYAGVTSEARPPLEFVPWVEVNGQAIKEDIGSFIQYICKAYKGTLPSPCHAISSDSPLKDETPHAYPVCYAKQDRNVTHI